MYIHVFLSDNRIREFHPFEINYWNVQSDNRMRKTANIFINFEHLRQLVLFYNTNQCSSYEITSNIQRPHYNLWKSFWFLSDNPTILICVTSLYYTLIYSDITLKSWTLEPEDIKNRLPGIIASKLEVWTLEACA